MGTQQLQAPCVAWHNGVTSEVPLVINTLFIQQSQATASVGQVAQHIMGGTISSLFESLRSKPTTRVLMVSMQCVTKPAVHLLHS